MPDFSLAGWVIIAAAVVVLAIIGIIVGVVVSHRRKATPTPLEHSTEHPSEQLGGDVVPAQEATVHEIPLAHQPAIPPEQAQGMGWMKASDLANQSRPTDS